MVVFVFVTEPRKNLEAQEITGLPEEQFFGRFPVIHSSFCLALSYSSCVFAKPVLPAFYWFWDTVNILPVKLSLLLFLFSKTDWIEELITVINQFIFCLFFFIMESFEYVQNKQTGKIIPQ